jgi:hypothetical protein
MTASGHSAVLFILLAAFLAATGYAAGRLHQWYQTGPERDEAYRDGYDTAARSTFSMAARIIGPRRSERAAIRASAPVRATPASEVNPCSPDVSSRRAPEDARIIAFPSGSPGRHTVPDELVGATTYRLHPDRVARATVRNPVPDDPVDGTPRGSVPKPRSS